MIEYIYKFNVYILSFSIICKNIYLNETFLRSYNLKNINSYIGSRIKNYRKMKKLTLQQLADLIHKSRATVSKYENGEITLDVETLYDISVALDISFNQLADYHLPHEEYISEAQSFNGESPFFKADRLYFYFYDGRYKRLKEAVIHIHKKAMDENGCYEASLSIHTTTSSGRSSEIYYTGNVLYSDMLIRFSFVNQCNKLEQDLLYIFNPLEMRDYTEGLLCGISSADLMPCAFKCLVTLTPNENYEEVQKHLMLTNKEIKRWQKLNMLLVDNRSYL